MASDKLEFFPNLASFVSAVGADVVFIVDANVLMRLAHAWEPPIGGPFVRVFAVTQATLQELSTLSNPRLKRSAARQEMQKKKAELASAAMRWLQPAIGYLHRGLIRADSNWILLDEPNPPLDPIDAGHLGHCDAAILAAARALKCRTPPAIILSNDGRLGQTCDIHGFEHVRSDRDQAMLQKQIQRVIETSRNPDFVPETIADIMAAMGPELVVLDEEAQIAEVNGEPTDAETISLTLLVVEVKPTEDGAGCTARGPAVAAGDGRPCNFSWDGEVAVSEDGELLSPSVRIHLDDERMSAKVSEGLQNAVREIVTSRLVPPARRPTFGLTVFSSLLDSTPKTPGWM